MDMYGEESREISNRIADIIAIISRINLLKTNVMCTLGTFLKSVEF
jgi:hypothetical protein